MLLCGPALDTGSCHYAYDHGLLDLYPVLDEPERRCAARLAGSAGAALRVLSAPLWRQGTTGAIALLDERLAALERLIQT